MEKFEVAKFIILFVVTYFFMQILTNKDKKLNIVGTIVTVFSPFIFWRGVPIEMIIGESIVILFHKFLISKNKWFQCFSIVGLSALIGLYFRPIEYYLEYFRNFLYLTYLAILIWLIILHKKDLLFNKKTLLLFIPFIIIGIVIACLIAMFWPIPNNNINNENMSINALVSLFSYGYNFFLIYENIGNNYLYSSFISLFPLPLIIAMFYTYKHEKNLEFLFPMCIVIAIEIIVCLSLKSTANIEMLSAVISLSCIYLYIYMIANIKEKIFSINQTAYIVLAFLVLYFLMPMPKIFGLDGSYHQFLIAIILSLLHFTFLNINDRRFKAIFYVFVVLLSIASTIPVLYL